MMTKRNISRDIRLSLGRSMIEMLGVLAIIGVLSIGGLYAYRQAMVRYQTAQIKELITQLRFALREDVNAEKKTVKDFTTKICSENGFACSEKSGNWGIFPQIPNVQWAVDISSSQYPGTERIQLRNLPRAVCKELVNTDWTDLEYLWLNDHSWDPNHKNYTASKCDTDYIYGGNLPNTAQMYFFFTRP